MKKQKILGIDPGTRVTGWAVVEEIANKYRVLDCGAIALPASATCHMRYLHIFEQLDILLNQHKVDALAIETQYVDKNVQSAIKLGMARGVVVLAALRLQVPVSEYAPTKVKQAVTGRGSASKVQVASMVKILTGLAEMPKTDDITDAIAIAMTHIHFSRSPLCMSM